MSLLRTVAVFVLLGTALQLGVRAQVPLQPSPRKERPVLEVSLGMFGYDTSELASGRWQTFTDFIDADHLAIAWLTTRKRTAANPGEPTSLHVLVVNIRTGEKKGALSMPTPLSAVRFAGIPDGEFLTCTGGMIRLWSGNARLLHELQLPHDHDCNGWLGEAGFSPSRKSLLLSPQKEPNKDRTRVLLRVDNLSTVAEWVEKCDGINISDNWLAGRCGRPREQKLFIRSFGQTWQPFQPISDTIGTVAFVGDDVLAIGAKNQVAVTTTDGKILFKVSAPDRDIALSFATSLGGARFAGIEGKLRGLRSEPLDMYPFVAQDRVVVYSIPDRRAIYAVNVKGTSPWAPWAPHFNHVALSPEGALLTIVSDDVLRVYRLPPAGAGTPSPILTDDSAQ
jgi:outer membrane protein assembly factor BamB